GFRGGRLLRRDFLRRGALWFLAARRHVLLLALLRFGALHLGFGHQSGLQQLFAQRQAHASILRQLLEYDNSRGELTMQRIHLISALALLALAPAAYAIPDANGNLVDPAEAAAPDLSQDGAMKARLNYNLGFETFQKTTQLEMAGASFTGAKAQDNAQA